EDTLKDLDGNTELEVDIEYEFLSITVFDKDPERAAAMSNFMVDRLNEMNGRLSSQHARVFRTSVEGRFNQAMADLDSLKNRTRDFQARYGVFDLEAQASAFLELVAQSRAEAIKLEIQHRGLLEQYGPDNPQVQLLGRMVEEAERTYQASLAGQEMVLPVSQAEVPQVNREFMDLEQDRLIQEAVLEVIAPIYEQAKFEEAREVTAVQIVDRAIPPARKARPARGIICILTTLSAGLLAVIYVLGSAWWTVQAPMVAAHLREPQPAPSPDVTV
ncbi:MAG: lipopolysaccharide biosynthesis protein, partial [Bacteroidota bacterium]